MDPSSPVMIILPYDVARGWVEGKNGHKVSIKKTDKFNIHINLKKKKKRVILFRSGIKLPDSSRK